MYLNRNGHKAGHSFSLLCKWHIYHFKERQTSRRKKTSCWREACTIGLILAVLYCPNIKYYIYPHMFTYTMHVELMFLVIFKTFWSKEIVCKCLTKTNCLYVWLYIYFHKRKCFNYLFGWVGAGSEEKHPVYMWTRSILFKNHTIRTTAQASLKNLNIRWI